MNDRMHSRLTPRQLLFDVMNVLHDHKTFLENIKPLTINDLNNNIGEINTHLEIEAEIIKSDIMGVLDQYREHTYGQAFQNDDVILNENTTLGETMAYLEQMMVSSDHSIWIEHIAAGRVFEVYNHLYQLSLDRAMLSEQILYEYYSKALRKIVECVPSDITQEIHVGHLKKYIYRIKPLKPIEDEKHPNVYVCPNCHQPLFSTEQQFCHHCGQKMATFQSQRR